MKRFIVVLAAAGMLASAASAQSADHSHNPAIKDGSPKTIGAPASGANSFTEDQAKGRFGKAGYTGVSKLIKKDGLWQGTAMKGGKKMSVMLDYKGNIITR